MRLCNKCGVEKPVGEFYRNPGMADGILRQCKSCTKATAAACKAAKPEYYRARERERNQKPERVDARKRYASKPSAIALHVEATRRFRGKFPEKYAANTAVNNAIRDGHISKQPCRVCGSYLVEAHHEDYSKPLVVDWFCTKHHRQRHKELAAAASLGG